MKQLQVKNQYGEWEDVKNIDYEENEAWTNSGCYRPALNDFRLTDPPEQSTQEIEPLDDCGLGLGVDALTYLILDKLNQVIEAVNKLQKRNEG